MTPTSHAGHGALAHAWAQYRESLPGAPSGTELAATEAAFLAGARAAYGVLYVLFHVAEDLDGVSTAFELIGAELGLDDAGAEKLEDS